MSIFGIGHGLTHRGRAVVPVGGFREDVTSYGSEEEAFSRKYRHWRGRSGRSYVFSVYAPMDCPPYEDAVLIVAARRGGAVLARLDLGPFPESRLAKVRRRFAERLDEVEFQIHVLAAREGERLSLLDDLTPMVV
jgi:hypothetical protein